MLVCVCGSIAKWLGYWPANRKVEVRFPLKTFWSYCCFLEQETSLTLFQLYNWGHSVNWGNSPPSCKINGYLLISGKTNVKLLSMSTNGCSSGGTSGAHTIILSLEQPHLAGHPSPPRQIYQHWSIAPE